MKKIVYVWATLLLLNLTSASMANTYARVSDPLREILEVIQRSQSDTLKVTQKLVDDLDSYEVHEGVQVLAQILAGTLILPNDHAVADNSLQKNYCYMNVAKVLAQLYHRSERAEQLRLRTSLTVSLERVKAPHLRLAIPLALYEIYHQDMQRLESSKSIPCDFGFWPNDCR